MLEKADVKEPDQQFHSWNSAAVASSVRLGSAWASPWCSHPGHAPSLQSCCDGAACGGTFRLEAPPPPSLRKRGGASRECFPTSANLCLWLSLGLCCCCFFYLYFRRKEKTPRLESSEIQPVGTSLNKNDHKLCLRDTIEHVCAAPEQCEGQTWQTC